MTEPNPHLTPDPSGPSAPAPLLPGSDAAPGGQPYRVLARKYRPQSFAGLIGQEALVRTLTNAIASDRLAHAWLLTGVRGVGKTTTARIIARALNCIGPDGSGGPTPEPCGVCANCLGIAEGRHPDVLEMDAASRTGVEDVRELIEGVRYRPGSARFKIYIIDEVHMLSNNAFNALLKTLEEPPEHVKFVFATTESRKVPVTVLSRCQRFDLRRIDEDTLARHYAALAEAEGIALDEGALRLIARAADGSVRDGLSILDQAIAAATGPAGGAAISEDMVRAMLGLADRTAVFTLFRSVMAGEIAEALDSLAEQHASGADPESLLNDLLDLCHWLTRIRIAPAVAHDPLVPEAERVMGLAMAETLSMPVLARCWQMLLKGLGEVQAAPHPMKALEMVLVRLAHAADLPSPADLVARLESPSGPERSDAAPGEQGPAAAGAPASSSAAALPSSAPAPRAAPGGFAGRSGDGSRPAGAAMMAAHAVAVAPMTERVQERVQKPQALSVVPEATPQVALPAPQAAPSLPQPRSFPDLVAVLEEAREVRLAAELKSHVHLVQFEPGRIVFRPAPGADRGLVQRLAGRLEALTGMRWSISLSEEQGAPSLTEQATSRIEAEKREAAEHPLVRAALDAFPGARIAAVRRSLPAAMPLDPDGATLEDEGEDEGEDADTGGGAVIADFDHDPEEGRE